MNAEMLLAHFDRVSNAPDAISRLRRFVLDLAVRGKLVEQDSRDEPASALFKRIAAEKARRLEDGTLRKEKPLRSVAEDEAPFAIPSNWSWARIGTCSLRIEYGTSVKTERTEAGVPVLKMGDIQGGQVVLGGQKRVPRQSDDLPQLFLKRFDLLYNRTNSAELVGKTGIYLGDDDAYTFASYLIRIRFLNELTSPLYANIAMNAYYFRETQILPEIQQQCGQANVNGSKLRKMMIPFPPLLEQHRIVARVDELMKLYDRLEEGQARQESCRRRLTTASLHHLVSSENPEASRANASFYLGQLGRLTDNREQIKQLRKAIVDLAATGRLVRQDPREETASKLLARLQKAVAVERQNEASRPRRPLLNSGAEVLGGVVFPSSWVTTRFDTVNVIVSGVAKGKNLRGLKTIGVPYLRVANVQRGYLDLKVIKEIEVDVNDVSRYELRKGDVLMTEGGDWDKLGRAAIWNEEIPGCIHQNHIYRIRPAIREELIPSWIALFANSSLGRTYFEAASKQTTNLASINMTQLRSCPLPIPPTAEQHRLVARVDELMALCDRLEAQLDATAAGRRRLLEAVLDEVLDQSLIVGDRSVALSNA